MAVTEHRIYNTKFNINTKNTMNFYDARAQKIHQMSCPYTAVLLGDQNPEHAKKWNDFEKENILPLIKIDKDSIIFDIGCGMGRWAEFVIPIAKYYYGIDFSNEMIKLAKERCCFSTKKYDFVVSSFQDAVLNVKEKYQYKFNRVIISGVCMYINDEDLSDCILKLTDYLDEHCVIYFTETVALEKRITLNECESVALKSTYDVIYRTVEEYNKFYTSLLDSGFKIVKQEYLPHFNNENNFTETERWFTILER